ncbi:MAG: PmoA family protein [Planctomycetales bacterium]|nr:PmoA family protein [Planctomycetales bacterium]
MMKTLLTAIGFLATCVAHASAITIEIGGNGIERRNAVTSVELPAACDEWSHAEVRDNQGTALPSQLSRTKPRQLFFIVDQLAANASHQLEVTQASTNLNTVPSVEVADKDGGFYAIVDGKTVFRYNHQTVESPPGLDPVFRRSGHIHPLYSPSGKLLTDDFCPSGHTHQHGVMFAWTNTSFEGRDVNFWEQHRKQGIVRHVATKSISAGPVFAEIRTTIEHVDLTSGEEKVVLEETWKIRVYNFSEQFVFDLTSRQKCVASTPFNINKYHYGGMAIRGNRDWTTANSEFATSNGKQRIDGNHDRPNWCEMYGKVDDQGVGVTLFCHPSNFRSPQPVRIHPANPYFCYAPLVLGGFQIKPQEQLVSNYRFVTHNGRLENDRANQMWLDYAQPIVTRLIETEQ